MKIKNIVLLLATGVCTGIVAAASTAQAHLRSISIGGEAFFFPMVCLLVWFGWMIHGEFTVLKETDRKSRKQRRRRNG